LDKLKFASLLFSCMLPMKKNVYLYPTVFKKAELKGGGGLNSIGK